MVILGLGSNLGDRRENLNQAIEQIRNQNILKELRLSSIQDSVAVLPPHAPTEWNKPYLNMAISGKTTLSPHDLLTQIKKIEHVLGRRPDKRWAPRIIDIDILTWEGVVMSTPDLTIPHPELLNRPFALNPLLELHPTWGRRKGHRPLFGHGQKVDDDLFVSPMWVGIVNITPDSFSDGGNFLDPQLAVDQAKQLFKDGAHVIDLGAESMRPGATPLAHDVEWERLSPVLNGLKKEFNNFKSGPLISVDTRHTTVAQRAIDSGVHWINDVSGFDDPHMRDVVAPHQIDIVVMHHLGTPPKKEVILPPDCDPVEILMNWAENRIDELMATGVEKKRIIFDPGIGFGKTAEQSLALIRGSHQFHKLGVRILVGHSRKSFMNLFTDKPFSERDVETSLISTHLVQQGIQYIRVHNVASNVRALAIAHALQE